jgi:hypothetical protein
VHYNDKQRRRCERTQLCVDSTPYYPRPVPCKGYARGITNELDVALAERYLATLQAGVAPLDAQIAASQHVVAVLLGQFPEDLAKELASPAKLPALPAQIAPGLPIDLLRRRPDIHGVERQLAAATARIGVATADLFPRVILSSGLGAQGGRHSASAIPITFIGAAGPSIYWPLIDFGTLDAIVDITELQAHELLVGYKQANSPSQPLSRLRDASWRRAKASNNGINRQGGNERSASTGARMSRRFRGRRCVPVSYAARPGNERSVRESLRR